MEDDIDNDDDFAFAEEGSDELPSRDSIDIFNREDDAEIPIDDGAILNKKVEKELTKEKPTSSASPDVVKSVEKNIEIVHKNIEEEQERRTDYSLKNRILNMKGDDIQEAMILLEDLIFAFHLAHGKAKEDNREKDEYTKRLNAATLSLKEYILDMKRVADNSSETAKNFEDVIANFQKEIVNLVREIDLSPMQKEIVDNINGIISKMPINEINQGVTNFIRIAGDLRDGLKLWDKDGREFEERLTDQRKKFKDIHDSTRDLLENSVKTINQANGKRFGFGSLLGVFCLGSCLSIAGSIYLYQDFFGSKFDMIAKNLQSNSNKIKVYEDEKGSYIVYDKNNMKMLRSGDEFKIYLKQ